MKIIIQIKYKSRCDKIEIKCNKNRDRIQRGNKMKEYQ